MTTPLDESTPVRSDVPLNMHPDALLGLSVVSAGREALRLCYDLFGRMNDAECAL